MRADPRLSTVLERIRAAAHPLQHGPEPRIPTPNSLTPSLGWCRSSGWQRRLHGPG